MKKILLVIVSAFSLSLTNAQTRFGIKAGVNLSTITGNNSDVFSSGVAAHAGVLANIAIGKQFSIQPEAVLSFENTKFSQGATAGRIRATYINLPLVAQYRSTSGFLVQTGPQLGFVMSANQKASGMISKNIKDDLKSTNFSWAFGAGYQPKNSVIGFLVRYNLGISNINAMAGSTNRTGSWQAGTFIMFRK